MPGLFTCIMCVLLFCASLLLGLLIILLMPVSTMVSVAGEGTTMCTVEDALSLCTTLKHHMDLERDSYMLNRRRVPHRLLSLQPEAQPPAPA